MNNIFLGYINNTPGPSSLGAKWFHLKRYQFTISLRVKNASTPTGRLICWSFLRLLPCYHRHAWKRRGSGFSPRRLPRVGWNSFAAFSNFQTLVASREVTYPTLTLGKENHFQKGDMLALDGKTLQSSFSILFIIHLFAIGLELLAL